MIAILFMLSKIMEQITHCKELIALTIGSLSHIGTQKIKLYKLSHIIMIMPENNKIVLMFN